MYILLHLLFRVGSLGRLCLFNLLEGFASFICVGCHTNYAKASSIASSVSVVRRLLRLIILGPFDEALSPSDCIG